MAQYKTIVVTVNCDISQEINELDLPKINAALAEGYQIINFYQIANNVSASSSTSKYGAVVLTYVLAKGL
jgi:hypothetical protein